MEYLENNQIKNQKIKALADEARKYAYETYSKQTMENFLTNKSVDTLYTEKLSQLIVQECIGLCSGLETYYAGNLNMTPNEIAKDTAKSCADIINEYFGDK